MASLAGTLARLSPALANHAWSFAYPRFFRRDEVWNGDEYDASRKDTFNTIFVEERWGSGETVSGNGSTLDQTIILRKRLPVILKQLGAKHFLDAPCGDFNWMKHVDFPKDINYIGGDIVPALIDHLGKTFSNDRRTFIELDIAEDKLPRSDLWLCRDVLFHLSNADIVSVLRNMLRSDVTFILTTTYPFVKQNRDICTGGFRFINLRQAPFHLPAPRLQIDDYLAPQPPRKLALWHRDEVAIAIKALDL